MALSGLLTGSDDDTQQVQKILETDQSLNFSFPPDPGTASAGTSLSVDESLHEYLVSTAGNAYIKDFFDRQGRYYRLLFEWEDHERAVAIETMRQHHEILTALLKKNWSAARKALSHHILDNHPILGKLKGIRHYPKIPESQPRYKFHE